MLLTVCEEETGTGGRRRALEVTVSSWDVTVVMNVFIRMPFSKERSAVSKQRGISILSVGVERTHLLDVVVVLVHTSASETFYPDRTFLCFSSVTSNFLLGWFQACASLLLGSYTVNSGNFLPTFRDNLLGPSWRTKNPKTLEDVTRLVVYAAWCHRRGQVSCWLVHIFVPSEPPKRRYVIISICIQVDIRFTMTASVV